MIRYVIDASAAVEYLLKTPSGLKVAETISDAVLLAPELLDVEVLSVIRRGVLQGLLEEDRAELAIGDLQAWPVIRIPHSALVGEAWKVRHNVSAYDAFYVAAGRLFEACLVTADARLSRTPRLGVAVRHVRIDPPTVESGG